LFSITKKKLRSRLNLKPNRSTLAFNVGASKKKNKRRSRGFDNSRKKLMIVKLN
jgi:hypothetical protein